MALDPFLSGAPSAAPSAPLLEMTTSLSLEKSVSELTRRADLRDSSRRTSSAFSRIVVVGSSP